MRGLGFGVWMRLILLGGVLQLLSAIMAKRDGIHGLLLRRLYRWYLIEPESSKFRIVDVQVEETEGPYDAVERLDHRGGTIVGMLGMTADFKDHENL